MLSYRKLKDPDDFGVFDKDGAYLGTVTKGSNGWVAVTADGKCVGDSYQSRDEAGEAL